MEQKIEDNVLNKAVREGETEVAIPDNVTEIGWGAFRGCTGLTLNVSLCTSAYTVCKDNEEFDHQAQGVVS